VGEKGPPPPIEGSGVVQRLYGGLDQQGPSLGDPDAPISISIFNDLQCTQCAEYQLDTVPRLVESLVRPGRARLEFRNFSIGPRETNVAAYAATAAGQQDFEWQYLHLVLLNIGSVKASGVTEAFLNGVAAAIPSPQFDGQRWDRDRDSEEVRARVESDAKLALDLRLPAMPAAVVEGPGGTKQLDNEPSVAAIEAAVHQVD
jgi:protein-disulfide isomerase